MKTFREVKWAVLTSVIFCALVLCMAAGVNGIFNSVNSVLGYQVNSGAGTVGQTLCSDGTRYDTACAAFAAVGSAGTSTCPTSVTLNAYGQTTAITQGPCFTHGSNSNGSWRMGPDGFIEQWGHLTGLSGAACNTITFPISFTAPPTKVSTIDDFASGGSVENAVTEGTHCAAPSTTAMIVWPSSGGNGTWWAASGY